MAVDIDGVNSTISTDKLIPQSGTALQIGDASDVITIPASATITNLGTATGFGGGKMLQCLQTVVSAATASTTSATMVDCTGMTVDITPTATTSKMLIFVDMKGSTGGSGSAFGLVRDSTNIYFGDAAGSRTVGSGNLTSSNTDNIHSSGAIFLDPNTPADTTTAITYKIQWETNGGTLYLNRTQVATDGTSWARLSSSITVMEIGA
jgi:hypothetical protein